ncbi:unnamed protein product [Bemisia tabaci]|uniref:Uncharacterized protein n=1 Tax=Bemisia tabaci TaxID=7038 RepID=A0A9P0F010_BEMTA|nr:unnamed protein product [Bemisia tabaci]
MGLTLAGEVAVPISEQAVVKSDRVGNNFAYSIRHEQRSVIPASPAPVAVPLSAHPVNVPNVFPAAVGSSSSSSSASSSGGSAVHQFKSASSTSSAVSSASSTQQQQAHQQAELSRVQQQQEQARSQLIQQQQQEQARTQLIQQQAHQQAELSRVQQQQEQARNQLIQQHQQQELSRVQHEQQQLHEQQQQHLARQQHDQQVSHQQHQQEQIRRQHDQQVSHQQHQELQRSSSSRSSKFSRCSNISSNSMINKVSSSAVSSASGSSGVSSGSSLVQAAPAAIAPPVLYQPLALQPAASVEVLQTPAATAAALPVYPPYAPAPADVYSHPPAAVGLFHYPAAPQTALVQGTATEVVRDTAKVVHQPPTLFFTQVAPAPEPQPAYAVYSTEVPHSCDGLHDKVTRPEALKLIDASGLRWSEFPTQKWAELPAQKWADATALKWNQQKYAADTSSPLRFGFAEPAPAKYVNDASSSSSKYAASDASSSSSKYAASDASKYSSASSASTSGSGVSSSGVASSGLDAVVVDNKLADARVGNVGHVANSYVKSESGSQESASSEAASRRVYSAAPAYYQQAFYDSGPRQYYSTGLVSEPQFYAARISHQPIYSPVPVQQALIPDYAAQLRGIPVPAAAAQVRYAAARQPVYVTGVHQASGQSTSHEAHSEAHTKTVY